MEHDHSVAQVLSNWAYRHRGRRTLISHPACQYSSSSYTGFAGAARPSAVVPVRRTLALNLYDTASISSGLRQYQIRFLQWLSVWVCGGVLELCVCGQGRHPGEINISIHTVKGTLFIMGVLFFLIYFSMNSLFKDLAKWILYKGFVKEILILLIKWIIILVQGFSYISCQLICTSIKLSVEMSFFSVETLFYNKKYKGCLLLNTKYICKHCSLFVVSIR